MEPKNSNNIEKLRAVLLDVEKLRSALLNIGQSEMDSSSCQFDEFTQSRFQVETIIVGTYNNMLILQVAGNQTSYISVICDDFMRFKIGERITLNSSYLTKTDTSKNIYTYSEKITSESVNVNIDIAKNNLSENRELKEVSHM